MTRLGDGYPEIPETVYAAPAAASAGEPPEGARRVGELAADPVEVALTLDHTDSNQHVNSLVYIRLFTDAVGRRLAAAGRPFAVRTRAVDIAYRKPCFAGDRVQAHVGLFERADGETGASGFLAAAGTSDARCYVRVAVTAVDRAG